MDGLRRLAVAGLLMGMLVPRLALAVELPIGNLDEAACRSCHDAVSVGVHEQESCLSCHGPLHEAAGAMARRGEVCVVCHDGETGAVARSYRTSKHGVIAGLEAATRDWSRPLDAANHRAPTCGYCHVRGAGHEDGAGEGDSCTECHSPRYVSTLLDSGRRSLSVGLLKLREAEAVAVGPEAMALLKDMTCRSFRLLRLGIGHQSPDYEWWHGHPALDGDLLRIKAVSEPR